MLRIATIALVVFLLAPAAHALTVGSWDIGSYSGASLFFNESREVGEGFASGSVFSELEASNTTTQFSLTDREFNISLSHRVDATALRTSGLRSSTSMGIITFTVDRETPYELGGFYGVSSGANIPSVRQSARLSDSTLGDETSDILFAGSQSSLRTAGESFHLGEQEGDLANSLTGSTIGILRPGRRYTLRTIVNINQRYLSSSPNEAEGYIRLRFGELSAPIPEPNAAVLFGTGLCLVASVRRRSR